MFVLLQNQLSKTYLLIIIFVIFFKYRNFRILIIETINNPNVMCELLKCSWLKIRVFFFKYYKCYYM